MSYLYNFHGVIGEVQSSSTVMANLATRWSQKTSFLQSISTEKLIALIYSDQLHVAIYITSVLLTVFMIAKTANRLKKALPGGHNAYLARHRERFANRHSRRPARWEHLLR